MPEELKIVVCAKQVPDPEGPPSSFELNSEEKRITPRGIPPVISPFDENALEAAVQLVEKHGGTVSILGVGTNLSASVYLKAIAVGAEDSYMVDDPELDPAILDSVTTAKILSDAIKKMGEFDLILTGRQAADTNAGQVPAGIAHILGLPVVTLAQSITVEGDKIKVNRELPDGYEVVEVPLPAVVSVTPDIGEIRYPKISAIKAAKKKPQTKWSAADVAGEGVPRNLLNLDELFTPVREPHCEFIEAEDISEAGAMLAQKLVEEKIL
ncbi:MAG: electron transfer flavoprotein subunit beta/FixA family protein [Actinobacteria bacterium]|nr:electron transfer flavoprotein subunit beta/FixA family protein [Actinomycetota bacterium]